MPNARAIRLGSLNTELGETRDFGRAYTLQNVDILKTNEISRRKGLVRRLEARAAGPIRMLHSFGGICGRFYSYFDGGGLISIVGPSYWAPTAFTATGAPPFIALNWKYQDKNGHRTTPPEGCTGVKIYRSTSAFIDTFDTGTLVYSGSGTSCVDDTAAPATDTAIFYTCYTVWEDNSRIVDPKIVMAWTYYIPAGWYVLDDFIYDAAGTQYDAIPAPEIVPSTGSLSDDNGTSITNPGVNRDRDEIEKAEAEAEIDEDDPTLSFSDSAERSALHNVDLYWAYNGPTKYNSGYTSIYRSTTAGMGTRGALIRREANLYNVYTDTTADDYTTQYYTFVHSVDGVGIYTYEKSVAAKNRSFAVTLPASAYTGESISITVQTQHWDGTTNTTYTPSSGPSLSASGSNTVSPTSLSTSGWSSGQTTQTITISGSTGGTGTVTVTDGTATGSDTIELTAVLLYDTFEYADGNLSGNSAWSSLSFDATNVNSFLVSGGVAISNPADYEGMSYDWYSGNKILYDIGNNASIDVNLTFSIGYGNLYTVIRFLTSTTLTTSPYVAARLLLYHSQTVIKTNNQMQLTSPSGYVENTSVSSDTSMTITLKRSGTTCYAYYNGAQVLSTTGWPELTATIKRIDIYTIDQLGKTTINYIALSEE